MITSLSNYPRNTPSNRQRSIEDENTFHKSLAVNSEIRSKVSVKEDYLTEVHIHLPHQNSEYEDSSSRFSNVSRDLGSPTLYSLRDAQVTPNFPSEAQGMAKLFKK